MTHDPPPALHATQLCAGYGAATVLRGLDLCIEPGAFTALTGGNGSGKSTLLHSFCGSLRPTAGKVELEGTDLRALAPRRISRRLAFLSQNPVAPEGLALADLIRLGRHPHRGPFARWSRKDEDACATAMQLTGTEAFAQRSLETLSGGQRQRGWIAMALAQQTDILLLDEPTTFLDLAHQIEVMELLVRLVRDEGKTVVAVLHDLNQAARHVDRMAVLRDGRILAEGRPDEVMTRETLRAGFGVDAEIHPDPVTGTPMCLPRPMPGTQRSGGEPHFRLPPE
ncbi:ABC transporter ATP-binding protein [Roseovarius atlanticus]|uniref:ABC transporter ATP-binding protein n=1 Tax=Roseovarius atlanticus TaxID=1641875 RepID=UPI001C9444F0|nr:ABC transporter ATP-binding protein [Roseovarius atlanticus]MBY5988822.1 ABC transporter ATP-binding protein [Roseovarius atlanticus]MBY6124213.1 ABC transporter ATP-binding protein [Roseovarius atlanticus]MBY6148708.1 ABC transporter ATP-binding protein [Roseovarius atlanticus]